MALSRSGNPKPQKSPRTWQNMWQGGSAMSGSAAGFHALSTRRRSLGQARIRADQARELVDAAAPRSAACMSV